MAAAAAASPSTPQWVYSCKRCREALFYDFNLLPHQPDSLQTPSPPLPNGGQQQPLATNNGTAIPPPPPQQGESAAVVGLSTTCEEDTTKPPLTAAGGAGVPRDASVCTSSFTTTDSPPRVGEQHRISGVKPHRRRTHMQLRSPACTSVFVEAMAWMGELADNSGKLTCGNPKCGQKLGSWCWYGLQCSCGMWHTPAFQVHLAKVDRMPLDQSANRHHRGTQPLPLFIDGRETLFTKTSEQPTQQQIG
eukprot:GHVS01084025.1.p1 GENE.GHVS01084025.1~~GHVS01084025.1.p1  ORF type:complete len:248 (-),score=68.88 GHVS01084025.1:733-1476(-)